MCQAGLEFLFDGYLIGGGGELEFWKKKLCIQLVAVVFLIDGYLMTGGTA
jgi:hypothetical protein